MSRNIDIDNQDLTYMLGFLTPEHWASAIRHKEVSPTFAMELLTIQDSAYSGSILEDVKELLALSDEDFARHMRARRPSL